MTEKNSVEQVGQNKKSRRKKATVSGTDADPTVVNSASSNSLSNVATATEPVAATAATNIQYIIEDIDPGQADVNSKKRGRKPRGGKLIVKPAEPNAETAAVSNIILHLKCSLSDLNDYYQKMSKLVTDPLKYNPDLPTEIQSYNDGLETFSHFDKTGKHKNTSEYSEPSAASALSTCNTGNARPSDLGTFCSHCSKKYNEINVSDISLESNETDNVSLKEINQKLKQLKIMLYKNTLQQDKKSACFWCTCDYDNTPCHIPIYEEDGVIYGYGAFCRPECGVAYLMKENLDDSTKFERYNMMNQIYGKVYNCKKNIKPAPSPYYTLEKFYGNLTIQEYRKLLKTEHLLLVLDKPFSRILPELHEDNDETIMNVYGINTPSTQVSGVYKVKRQSEKQQVPKKNTAICNKFFSSEQ